jgi:hypothetical protein
MSNVINFKPLHSEPKYTIHWESDGEKHSHVLDGEETFSTLCQKCGKRHYLEFEEFVSIIGDEHPLYDTHVNCRDCSLPYLDLS